MHVTLRKNTMRQSRCLCALITQALWIYTLLIPQALVSVPLISLFLKVLNFIFSQEQNNKTKVN